ncbi:MAG: hypothetical protein BGO68_04475 [Candidatus Amoebophilus sp. 36-38]|nr:MAG: hypothetical protein BGO68_04475 [Candidatus Amoebophilus sp. 36-38]
MKSNYKLNHRLIALILLFSLFLQSCDNSYNHNQLIPQEKETERNEIPPPSTKIRKGLDLALSFQTTLLQQLPSGYELGEAYGEGDCFFDALAQWINKSNHTDLNTGKYLRMLCHEFYQKNKKLVADWDLKDNGEKAESEDKYAQHEYAYSKIQYTAEECESLFNKDVCIWGRPWVEGLILCRKLNLKCICFIEVLRDPETDNPVVSYHMANQEGYKSSISEEEGQALVKEGNTPVLVNVQRKLHFVPLWKKGVDVGWSQNIMKPAHRKVKNQQNEQKDLQDLPPLIEDREQEKNLRSKDKEKAQKQPVRKGKEKITPEEEKLEQFRRGEQAHRKQNYKKAWKWLSIVAEQQEHPKAGQATELLAKIEKGEKVREKDGRKEIEVVKREDGELLKSLAQEMHQSTFPLPEKTTKNKPNQATFISLERSSLSSSINAGSTTSQKLEEIIKQINKVQKYYKKLKSNELQVDSFIMKIKESLLRISWRVSEIPSYDKFHMTAYFPERNWLLLDHLSDALNSPYLASPQRLKAAVLSLSEDIIKIKEAIPIIDTIITTQKLEEGKEKVKLPHLHNLVSFFMDTVLLGKMNHAINIVVVQVNSEGIESFIQDEENKRSLFRALEIIGECAKYISPELKALYRNIPWLSSDSQVKGNPLTTIRNKFHHDRDKIELVLKYESNLLKSLVVDLIFFLEQEIGKLLCERGPAIEKLQDNDFKSLNSSLISKMPTPSLSLYTAQESVEFHQESISKEEITLTRPQETLETILDVLDKAPSELNGWKIKELLSYIKEGNDAVYKLFLKRIALPETENTFIELVRSFFDNQKISELGLAPEDIEEKFRSAYPKLKGKRLSEKELDDAFKKESGGEPARTIEDIRNGIKAVILYGKGCCAKDFRKSFLDPVLFRGMSQEEGEEKLERLRSTVSTDISKEAVNDLFNFSEEEKQEIEEKAAKKLQDSNKILNKLKDIPKVSKISKGDISQLVGLTHAERDTLFGILSKEPRKELDEEAIKKDIIKKLNIKNLGSEKAIREKIEKFCNLIGVQLGEEDKKQIIDSVSKKDKKDKNNELIKQLFGIAGSIEGYKTRNQGELIKKQRSVEDIDCVQCILSEIPTTKEKFKEQRAEVEEKIKSILCGRIDMEDSHTIDLLLQTGCYPTIKAEHIKAKYKKLNTSSAELEKNLNSILTQIDEHKTPGSYLREVVGHEWLLPLDTPDIDKEHFQKSVEEAGLNYKDFEHLFTKKENHELTQDDIENTLSFIDSHLSGEKNKSERANILKEVIKRLISLSEKSFRKLVKKAGYPYKPKFQKVYQRITDRSKNEPTLKNLKKGLHNSIQKLNFIFDELARIDLNKERRAILQMSAEYLIEEIGPLAEKLTERKDFRDSPYLSLSKRNLYLIAMCRKATAHYPLGIDESLVAYLIDQLVLDTRVRLSKDNSGLRASLENLKFNKTGEITGENLEQKRIEICATLEGLGFKNDFKLFGKAFGCDIGVQGDLNILVEYDTLQLKESEGGQEKLIELEIRLSKELNGDVRVYTADTLRDRLKTKVNTTHLAKLKESTVYTLEDIIQGNKFIKIFEEDRWSVFRLPDGRIFMRSQYLEKQDLEKIFTFLLGENYSLRILKEALDDKERLFNSVLEKLKKYEGFPEEYSSQLNEFFILFRKWLSTYHTDFSFLRIPFYNKLTGMVDYEFLTLLNLHPQNGLLSLEQLPESISIQEYNKLHEFLRTLYVQSPTSAVFQRVDQRVREAHDLVLEKRKIRDIAITAQEICDTIICNKEKILKNLSDFKQINAATIFNASSVLWMYRHEELKKEREATESFRKDRLKDKKILRDIIKEKSRNYIRKIIKALIKINEEERKLILESALLGKEIDQILTKYYNENEEKIIFLWGITDPNQRKLLYYILKENGKAHPEIISGLNYFRLIARINFELIKNEQDRSKILELVKEHKEVLERFKCYLFNTFLHSSFASLAEDRLRQSYHIFSRIRNPRIVQILIDNNGNLEGSDKRKARKKLGQLVERDLTKQYCEKVEMPFSFVTGNFSTRLMDFSSEVECVHHENRETKKIQLERDVENNLNHLPSSLREFILQGKDIPLARESDTILGFGNSDISIIHQQISAIGHSSKRIFMKPEILTENLPDLMEGKLITGIGIDIKTTGTSKLKIDITDLNDLMDILGWSIREKAEYKKHNNFEYENLLIKEYYDFHRTYGQLEKAQNRAKEYKRKISDIEDRLSLPHGEYSKMQRLNLKEKLENYKRALAQNFKIQRELLYHIAALPYTQKRIEQALHDPYLIETMCNKATESGGEAILEEERQCLQREALEEVCSHAEIDVEVSGPILKNLN